MSNKRALAMCLDLLGFEMAKSGERSEGRLLIEEAFSLIEPAAKNDPSSSRAQREASTIKDDLAKLSH
jgi:hypothetical protein